MPRERRTLVFNTKEVAAALLRHTEMFCGIKIAPESVLDLSLGDDQATMALSCGTKKVFGEAMIVQALVWWCIEHAIPLPIAGQKDVCVKPDSITLEVRIES